MPLVLSSIAVLICCITGFNTWCESAELQFDFESFRQKASVHYEKKFVLAVSLDRWNGMLDRPALMGQLWELIEGEPLYRISMSDSMVCVVDPTGIEGRLALVRNSRQNRLYYGSGKMNHWFVPLTVKGKAVVTLDSSERADGTISVTLNIYGEGGKDRITRLMLKSVSPLICYGIERRVKHNLKDLERMLKIMDDSPDDLRDKLKGIYVTEFDALSGYVTRQIAL